MVKKSDDKFSKKEAAQRFEAALKGARLVMKAKPKDAKAAKKAKK